MTIKQLRKCAGCGELKPRKDMIKITKDRFSEEVVINPIQELIDRKYYNTLTLDAKQKYVYELAEQYKKMKSRYIQEHEHLAYASNI